MPTDPLVGPGPPEARPPRPLLEVEHAAHRLSASPEYVRVLIRTHKLAAIRLGKRYRIEPDDLEAFIENRRQAANGNGHKDR